MADRAKNHHIVPKVLQKQFAIEKDCQKIWRAKRDAGGFYTAPETKKISKAFVKRDYNTILVSGQRSDRVEREFYGKLDDFLGQIIPEFVKIFEQGHVPNFSQRSLASIRSCVTQMARRTPDFIEDHDDVETGRQLIASVLKALPEDASPDERKKLESDLANVELLRDKGRHIRVTATLKESPRVKSLLTEFSPRWAICEGKHSFILSSLMVYRIGNGGPNGLVNPKMEMWMPVSPKVSLVLLRDPNNRIPIRNILSPAKIREINDFAVKHSYEVGSHSERLLNSLLK